MPAIWPATLPPLTEPQQGTYSETPGEKSLRTEMAEGAPKVRRLPGARPDVIQGTYLLTVEQTVILDTFYKDTLLNGTSVFDTTHPRLGVNRSFRFLIEPPKQPVGGRYWLCAVRLEVLP